jgi:aspartate/methionine/tyrosine aminotransferase
VIARHKDGFDLAAGEPAFLSHFIDVPRPAGLMTAEAKAYPDVGGLPRLLEALRKRHPGKHVVVTNGARQAIEVAVRATSRKTQDGLPHFFVKRPYWPGFEDLAELMGCRVDLDGHLGDAPVVGCSLNNPDGAVLADGRYDVLDCAYQHPVYGAGKDLPEHRVSCWSAGKLFGCPGLRVGWAVTEDEKLASEMARLVEDSTGGVGNESQLIVAYLVERDLCGGWFDQYDHARQTLLVNGKYFLENLGEYLDDFRGAPFRRGMFAWFRPIDGERFEAALKKNRIHLVEGRECGGARYGGWWRMNLGADHRVLRPAIYLLASELAL